MINIWPTRFVDDGKIFIGSGVGDPFGPPCHKGKNSVDLKRRLDSALYSYYHIEQI